MKDLIISWNEDKGFYCDGFSSQLFSDVLIDLIIKYSLSVDGVKMTSEVSMYFTLKEVNKEHYNIILQGEDGSDWVFG